MPTVHISSSLKENVEILSYDGFGTFYQNRISYQDADAKVLLDFNQELILHRFCRGYNLIFHFQKENPYIEVACENPLSLPMELISLTIEDNFIEVLYKTDTVKQITWKYEVLE